MRVADVLGEHSIDVLKPDMLLARSAIALDSEPLPPAPQSNGVDWYKCYRVKTPPTASSTIVVRDALTPVEGAIVVKRPTHLCTAVSSRSGNATASGASLLCHAAKPIAPLALTVHPYVSNVLGPLHLDPRRTKELCLPSMLLPP